MGVIKVITISKRAELAVKGGHPWVYGTEVEACPADIKPGDIVRVLSKKGKFIGSGFYNPQSKITVRIISTNANDVFDDSFWKRRVAYAIDYRLQVMRPCDFNNMRLIFGEADQLPGLTVDRFEDILSVQILSLGMELRKESIINSLIEVLRERKLSVSCVYERNDVKIRELEGISIYKGFFKSPLLKGKEQKTIAHIVENGITYNVDVENGQKTGYFLDQKSNRILLRHIARDKRVLDCFSHTGGFALNAAYGNAKAVTAVDVSNVALQQGYQNAKLNHLEDKIQFVQADVFDYLEQLKDNEFDIIVLDPPAFTKSRTRKKSVPIIALPTMDIKISI